MNKKFELLEGEISLWVEQESVHIKAVDPHGDPVELTSEMCKDLARALEELALIVE